MLVDYFQPCLTPRCHNRFSHTCYFAHPLYKRRQVYRPTKPHRYDSVPHFHPSVIPRSKSKRLQHHNTPSPFTTPHAPPAPFQPTYVPTILHFASTYRKPTPSHFSNSPTHLLPSHQVHHPLYAVPSPLQVQQAHPPSLTKSSIPYPAPSSHVIVYRRRPSQVCHVGVQSNMALGCKPPSRSEMNALSLLSCMLF